jgi:hypothetical protein
MRHGGVRSARRGCERRRRAWRPWCLGLTALGSILSCRGVDGPIERPSSPSRLVAAPASGVASVRPGEALDVVIQSVDAAGAPVKGAEIFVTLAEPAKLALELPPVGVEGVAHATTGDVAQGGVVIGGAILTRVRVAADAAPASAHLFAGLGRAPEGADAPPFAPFALFAFTIAEPDGAGGASGASGGGGGDSGRGGGGGTEVGGGAGESGRAGAGGAAGEAGRANAGGAGSAGGGT